MEQQNTPSSSPLLDIQNLSVDFSMPSGVFRAVKDISFSVRKGETLALVGESGSGKSVSANSIMQLLPYPTASHPSASKILFQGQNLLALKENDMRNIRGHRIGMIFQEPLSALNPLHTIEKQIGEVLMTHQKMDRTDAQARVKELLDLVQLPKMRERMDAYPHELSGGQRQRILIAMALANRPELLIADEPTTALDVTVQAQILELLKELQQEFQMAMILITHDLPVVEKMADTIAVMKHGEIVEQGACQDVFANPAHDYTIKLLNAHPKGHMGAVQPNTPVILSGVDIKVHFPKKKNFFGKVTEFVKAVDGVSFDVHKGHTLGIVGESGSGKSTLAFAALKLLGSEGDLILNGHDITSFTNKQMLPLREDLQVVFQDPYGSLSPRMSVGQIIAEGLKVHHPKLDKKSCDERVIEALHDVQLDPETRHRYPHEFSGGQRQRICIARALVLRPRLIVLDEPTSALDVSVQAEIVALLKKLQKDHGLSYVFISHDLRVVRAMSHEILVMKDGRVVEHGSAADIFKNPQQEYTKMLLDAALNLKSGS